MASIMNCWTCNVKLSTRPEDCFFWCCEEHKMQHFDEQKEKFYKTRHEHTDKVKVSFDFSKHNTVSNTENIRQLEDTGKTDKRVYTCKLCGGVGHNSRGCTKK